MNIARMTERADFGGNPFGAEAEKRYVAAIAKARRLNIVGKHESIVTAYAERAAGPGWANSPIWVIVRDSNQRLREECIQPADQTPEMFALYDVSEAAHKAMTDAVRAAA